MRKPKVKMNNLASCKILQFALFMQSMIHPTHIPERTYFHCGFHSLALCFTCIRLYIYQTIRISNDSILIFCIFLVLSIRRQLLSPNIQQKHYLNNGYAMDGGRHVSTLTTASIDSFIVRDLSFNAIIHKSKVELCFQFFVRVFAFAWHPDWPPLLGPRRAAACSTECGILQINIGEAR